MCIRDRSTVMQALHDAYEYTIAQSYTDRPQRTPDEQGHVFLSPAEFDTLSGLILPRSSQDGRYGMTEEMLDKDGYKRQAYETRRGKGMAGCRPGRTCHNRHTCRQSVSAPGYVIAVLKNA